MKMPYHKSKEGEVGSFHNLDKGNKEKGWPFLTEHWTWEYVYIFHVYGCIILASEASQKKIDNDKANTTVGPPLLPIKPLHKTPPLTNLRGVRTPGPPPSGSALGSVNVCLVFKWDNWLVVVLRCSIHSFAHCNSSILCICTLNCRYKVPNFFKFASICLPLISQAKLKTSCNPNSV